MHIPFVKIYMSRYYTWEIIHRYCFLSNIKSICRKTVLLKVLARPVPRRIHVYLSPYQDDWCVESIITATITSAWMASQACILYIVPLIKCSGEQHGKCKDRYHLIQHSWEFPYECEKVLLSLFQNEQRQLDIGYVDIDKLIGLWGISLQSQISKFQTNSTINMLSIFCEIAIRWMPQHLTNHKSTLVQVMARCRQVTSHYLSQCWPRSL